MASLFLYLYTSMLKGLIKVLVVLYLLASIGLYFAQNKIIFYGHPYPEDKKYPGVKELEIAIDDGLTMNAALVQAKPQSRSKGAILYLHGNKGNVRRGIYQSRSMQNRGYDLLIPDYRGYGKTEGQPINDTQLLTDANKAYQYLKDNYEEDKIYVVGYSLGSGMASYVAKENNPAGLILVAPFTSLEDIKNQFLWMFPDFLLKYKLSNEEHLNEVKAPVTILHGTADNVVKYKYGAELKTMYPETNLITFKGESHRGIIFRLSEVLNQKIPYLN